MQDGPKRHGRFLKKDSSVFKKVSLVEFAFQEMSSTNTITHDNPKRSIIHADFHDREALENALKKHEKMEMDLVPPEERPPVIIPRDFTADWEKDRSIRKRKVTRFDDEDYEFELDSLKKKEASLSEAKLMEEAELEKRPLPKTEAPLNAQTSEALQKSPKTAWETMDAVGKAINELHAKDFAGQASHSNPQNELKGQTPLSVQETNASKQMDDIKIKSNLDASSPKSSFESDFTSVSPVDEEMAVKQYQKQQQELARIKQEFESELGQILAQEKARAYHDGFRVGEEKAEEQTRAKAQELFKNITSLVSELTELKFSILNNVQENFYTICQAIGEALVKREFSIHPETFAEVLRRALAETVQPTNLKIHVHPEMFDRLASLELPDIKPFLVKDNGLETSGFRLESHLSVIDGSISEMISKMLKSADLDLFEKSNTPHEQVKKSA